MGVVVDLAEFSSKQDKSPSKEKGVLLENVLGQENQVANGVFTAELASDLLKLTKTELRKKYKHEESTHRNRKNQCKGSWAAEFEDFKSFLAHAGICPHPGWTLDRINNDNPDYGPKLCRWASPKTQTRNRSNTVVLVIDGDEKPLAEWAEITSQDPEVLRKRKQRGWPDREVVFGKVSPRAPASDAETAWRALLPERMWPQWEWFEQNTVVYGGDYLPDGLRSTSAEFLNEFAVGPRGRALRLYTTAASYVTDLGEQLADAQQYAEQFGGDEPDPKLVKAHEFWIEARGRALAVLRGCVR